MLGISQGTLNFFGIIIVALIGLLGVIITNRGNKKVESVKEDTSQINNFDTVEQKIDGFTEVVNGLMIMHVKTSEDITSIREAVDNRKNSFKNDA